MRKVLIALLALCSFTALARTVEGINLPDSVQVESTPLSLNGAGLRTKTFLHVKVYVIGLYTAQKGQSPQAVIAPDQPKQIQMVLMRDVDKEKIIEAINEGFEHNSKQDLPKLQGRLGDLAKAIPDLKEGNKLIFTYVPGKGTLLGGVAKPVVIPGKDFYDALLGCWLGRDPVDDDLKAQMLGKNP